MQLSTVAILFAFAIGGDSKCISIRRLSYETEVLKSDVESPYQLAIDYDTNTLFFSYTARAGDDMFKSAYLSLKTRDYGLVTGIHGGFANAVNSKSSIVYMGGEDGIYTFDYNAKNATNLHIKEANIWQMFYKDGLYFTTYPEEKAYFYKNDNVVEVPALQNVKVMLIAVTNDKDLVYSNSSGVFLYSREENKTFSLSEVVANGITSDIGGNIYFSSPNGIYYVNEKTKTVEYLVSLDNIYGIAIESNGNFIYAEESRIIRLKATKKACESNLPKLVQINF